MHVDERVPYSRYWKLNYESESDVLIKVLHTHFPARRMTLAIWRVNGHEVQRFDFKNATIGYSQFMMRHSLLRVPVVKETLVELAVQDVGIEKLPVLVAQWRLEYAPTWATMPRMTPMRFDPHIDPLQYPAAFATVGTDEQQQWFRNHRLSIAPIEDIYDRTTSTDMFSVLHMYNQTRDYLPLVDFSQAVVYIPDIQTTQVSTAFPLLGSKYRLWMTEDVLNANQIDIREWMRYAHGLKYPNDTTTPQLMHDVADARVPIYLTKPTVLVLPWAGVIDSLPRAVIIVYHRFLPVKPLASPLRVSRPPAFTALVSHSDSRWDIVPDNPYWEDQQPIWPRQEVLENLFASERRNPVWLVNDVGRLEVAIALARKYDATDLPRTIALHDHLLEITHLEIPAEVRRLAVPLWEKFFPPTSVLLAALKINSVVSWPVTIIVPLEAKSMRDRSFGSNPLVVQFGSFATSKLLVDWQFYKAGVVQRIPLTTSEMRMPRQHNVFFGKQEKARRVATDWPVYQPWSFFNLNPPDFPVVPNPKPRLWTAKRLVNSPGWNYNIIDDRAILLGEFRDNPEFPLLQWIEQTPSLDAEFAVTLNGLDSTIVYNGTLRIWQETGTSLVANDYSLDLVGVSNANALFFGRDTVQLWMDRQGRLSATLPTYNNPVYRARRLRINPETEIGPIVPKPKLPEVKEIITVDPVVKAIQNLQDEIATLSIAPPTATPIPRGAEPPEATAGLKKSSSIESLTESTEQPYDLEGWLRDVATFRLDDS